MALRKGKTPLPLPLGRSRELLGWPYTGIAVSIRAEVAVMSDLLDL